MTDSTIKLSNILVIDDDDISNFIYTRVIAATGFSEKVKSCSSGQEALVYLEGIVANQPDQYPGMIFLDINMPVMNGWDFLEEYDKRISKDMQEQSILCIFSSSVYKEDIDKAHSYPQVKEYVPKPLTTGSMKILMKKYFN